MQSFLNVPPCESLIFLNLQIHPYTNFAEVKEHPDSFKKCCMCLGVCQRECERVSETDFYSFFFFFESPGHCDFKVHISQVSHNMSSFFKLLKKPFPWSVRKPQRARLWLLYPIAYPSSKRALDLNAERQCKQLPSHLSQDMQARPVFLCCYEARNLILLWSVHTDHGLHNAFQIYSRVSWRTRHICSLTIDMLLKTAVSGTTVKYALSMTEPSSIMRTSIPSLFPLHFLDLREKIAPWSERIPSYKPLKTT